MSANTKAWATRLTEIKTTIRGTSASYRHALIDRIDGELARKTDPQKKTLSDGLHLNKERTKRIRDLYRAIALVETLFVPVNPRTIAQVVRDHAADAEYLVLSELVKLIKGLDPASPNPPDLARHRPLLIGVSISGGNHPGPGSIACFVLCNQTGQPMILGNEHVMRAEFGTATRDAPEIYQPSKGNGAGERDAVATYARGILDARIDAAVAYLKGGVEYANRTPEGEALRGSSGIYRVGQSVWKRGTASRRTDGRIEDVSANKSVPHARFGGAINFANQIEVKVAGAKSEFQIPGDSGSALFNDQNEIIGIMHGGGMNGGGIATPIQRVFDLLDVRLP
jgi:hypothetical protein